MANTCLGRRWREVRLHLPKKLPSRNSEADGCCLLRSLVVNGDKFGFISNGMIASRTPPQKSHRKPPSQAAAGEANPLPSPKLSLPVAEHPSAAMDSNGSPSGSSSGGAALMSRGGAGATAFRLHPRFRNIEEDERDDALLVNDYHPCAPVVAGGEVARPGEVQRIAAHRQQQPMAPRPASWSSWTTVSSGGQPGGTTWRRHFRTDSDGVATAAASSVASLSRFHADSSLPRVRETATTELPRSATLSETEYQRFHQQHAQRTAAAQQRTGVRAVSVPAGSSIATRHYSSWQQWNGQPGLALGRSSFVQQSRTHSAPPSQFYATAQLRQAQQAHPQTSFASTTTPTKPRSFPSATSSSQSMPSNNNEPQTSKRLLSPQQHQQQQETPLFKKAKGFDKLDLLCSATLEIGELHDNPTGCSCPKSKCVALYCDCFKAGRRCNPSQCSCLDCKNTIAESGMDGARTKAIRCILARNPRAFRTAGEGNKLLKLPPGEIACNCVRSRCLKLYCSCFHNGKACKAGICTCVGCRNTTKDLEGHRKAAIEQALEKRPDAFKVKVKEKGLGCACKNNRCIKKYCDCYRTQLRCKIGVCTCRHCENQQS